MSRLSAITHRSLLNFLLIFCFVFDSKASNELKISTQDVSIKIDETANLTLTLNSAVDRTIEIRFTCDHTLNGPEFNISDNSCRVISGFQTFYRLEANQTVLQFQISGANPGRQTLIVNTNDNRTNANDAFIRVNVGRNKTIDVVAVVIGWLYFAAWSVSFYPQMWTNFKRKSVVGLNFDFIGLNITGFICYSLFNVCLYFSPLVQRQFEDKYPRSLIPVEDNDVVFALHAVFATLIVIIQCFIYERANQRVSIFAKVFLVVVWLAAIALAIVVTATTWVNWLTYLYFFSYIKLTITIIKYIPQAWYNYKRQSTLGWSIGNILLDFTGGSLSILQMFLLAYNYDDWLTIFKNFTKFGLGMVSILFDILFIVQHYCLYRDRSDSEITRLTTGLNTSTADLVSAEGD